MMRKTIPGLIFILLLFFHNAEAMHFSHNEAGILPSPPMLAEPFTEHELQTASPFDPDIIQRTFFAVAEKMYIRLRPDVPFPQVVVSTDIPVEKLPEFTGIEIGANTINYFGYLKNTILLMKDSKIHNLAHEMVHYFQFHYHIHGDMNKLTYDPEPQAVQIQNYFHPERRLQPVFAAGKGIR